MTASRLSGYRPSPGTIGLVPAGSGASSLEGMPAHGRSFFLPADPGQRYCIFHAAQGRPLGQVVMVHAFAEELNKTRRMAALQSRALAQCGYAVLQIDLLGCGDSSGDFGDASWTAWLHDLRLARNWLQEQMPAGEPVPLWVWGVRAGCLLAADFARAAAQPCHLLFWQPSFASGRQQLQQFLRLRLAADLLSGGAGQHGGALQALEQELAAGKTLDIAGYALSPALARGLSASALEPAAPAAARLVWLEVAQVPREPGQFGPAATRILQAWEREGWSVHARCVAGPAFWQTVETEEAPELLVATQEALAAAAAP